MNTNIVKNDVYNEIKNLFKGENQDSLKFAISMRMVSKILNHCAHGNLENITPESAIELTADYLVDATMDAISESLTDSSRIIFMAHRQEYTQMFGNLASLLISKIGGAAAIAEGMTSHTLH